VTLGSLGKLHMALSRNCNADPSLESASFLLLVNTRPTQQTDLYVTEQVTVPHLGPFNVYLRVSK
jgi:hypothetical protein